MKGCEKMGKNGSLKYQMKQKLQSMAKYGHSKHADKQENGGKPALDKIYSRQTMATYKAVADEYASWCRNNGIKTMEQAEQATGDYLRERMGANLSAWTIRRDAAALGKLFQKSTTELGVSLPRREREAITRSRNEVKGFSESKNQALVDFCRATGLRRSEVASLSPKDVYKASDGRIMVSVNGKGGRERILPCLNEKPLQMALEAISEGRSRVIDHIPNRTPCHVYRAEYAQGLYNSIEKNGVEGFYRCKGTRYGDIYDKQAMKEVSEALGHSRLDVVISYFHETPND